VVYGRHTAGADHAHQVDVTPRGQVKGARHHQMGCAQTGHGPSISHPVAATKYRRRNIDVGLTSVMRGESVSFGDRP
jgi:hypothetical protein